MTHTIEAVGMEGKFSQKFVSKIELPVFSLYYEEDGKPKQEGVATVYFTSAEAQVEYEEYLRMHRPHMYYYGGALERMEGGIPIAPNAGGVRTPLKYVVEYNGSSLNSFTF